MAISVGDKIPNTKFMSVPYTPELEDAKACGVPESFQTHDRLKGQKAVIVSVPGCFTPTCHVNHIPKFISQAQAFADKGYKVYVIAANDPFVMSGWRAALGGKDEIQFASDIELEFSKALGATADLSKMGFGLRGGRYAVIVDDLVIKSLDVESNPGEATVSSAETVLGKL